MLLKKFEDGKRYKFTKERYLETRKPTITPLWVDEIDQIEVLVQHEECGHIESYIIHPEWCEEIDIEPLKSRDDIKDMYKQLLYLEELEETLDFIKYINSEIERVIDELGLEE